jgi:hypothetical protein
MEQIQKGPYLGPTQSAVLSPFPAYLLLSATDVTSSPTSDIAGDSSEALVKGDYYQNSHAQEPMTFFDLPAEVRLEIFERCVSPIRTISPFDHRFRKVTAASQRFTDYSLLPVLFADSSFPINLLLLSKRVAAEAQDAVYRKISFELIATHARYMFAYSYYLAEHPMRLTEQLNLRILHDIWTSRHYGGIPRLHRGHWEHLSRLVADMPNLRRLTVRILHCSHNEDVDSFEKYVLEGMEELASGLHVMQHALKELPVKYVVEYAAPESDYMNPEHRELLVTILRNKGLPVTLNQTCSWLTVSTQDSGAYIWSPVGAASDISTKGLDMLGAKEQSELENVPANVNYYHTR